MTNNPQQSIDEILSTLIETYYNPTPGTGYYKEDAKTALKEVVDGIIGLDEYLPPTKPVTKFSRPSSVDYRNGLRLEQHKRAAEVFGDDK